MYLVTYYTLILIVHCINEVQKGKMYSYTNKKL